MNDVIRHVRWSALAMLVIAAVCAPAAAAASGHGKTSPPGSNGHPYRHGVVPPRGQNKSPATSTASGTGPLAYGGGISNGSSTVGVVTAAPKVYLVFWGSQWGTQGTNAAGNVTLSGDAKGVAPYVESFIKGIGTNNETWSGVMTQYCQGVAAGSTSCPSTAAHVGYPTGGAFAGVWVDESAAAPSQATGHQIAAEAVNAATHFGNTTQASNMATQYVIVSPHGTYPDGFNTPTGNFCAWHDYTADSALTGGAASSPDGYLQFTNLPYMPDAGASCGQNFVNANGPLDGVSIVEGHEYAETITDPYPAGGWTDTTGYENGDKCAWITPGTTGGSFELSLATGSFAVQTTWGNDGGSGNNGCEASHAIVGGSTGGANTVTVTNPGNQTSTVGSSASLQMTASDSASGQTLTYTATGLPAGLSISSTGLISGTPTTAGTSSVTVSAKDGTGASGNTTFTWTVNPAGGGSSCTAKQLLGNPGFETGSASPWSTSAGVISATSTSQPSHSGSYFAWLDGYGTTHTDTLSQAVTVPSGCSTYTLSFWLHIDTAETTTSVAYDTLKVEVVTSTGTTTLATYSNLNHNTGYAQRSFNLSAFAGKAVTLKFTGTEDSSLQTSFAIDDTALNVS